MADDVRQIVLRAGTSEEWAASGTVLALGELGFDSTLKRVKAGDGVNAWAALGWSTMAGSDVSAVLDAATRIEAAGTPTDAAMAVELATPGSQSRAVLSGIVTDELGDVAGPAVDAALQDSGRLQSAATAAVGTAIVPSLPGGRQTDGTRHVPQLITSSLSPVTVNDVAAQHQRHPFRAAADVRRARLHVRNFNLATETGQAGAIDFTGVYFGSASTSSAGNLTGSFSSAPTKVLDAFSTPADGSEYVSAWFDLNYAAYAEGMLSLGWSAAAGQIIHRSRALTWVSATPSDAAVANPAQSLTQTAYFDIYLEVEVSATVPVVAYFGDSLTVGFSGGGSNQPQILRDSWATQHALQHGHLAMLYAFSGAKLADFADTAASKWARWAGMTRPDAAIIALGSNDIFDSVAAADLATTTARLQSVIVNTRAQASKQIYATTVLPRNGSDAAKEAVRVAYNDYLRGTPQFVMNTWDVAEALEDPANRATLRAPFVGADGTHLTRGGNRRQATAVNAPLVRVALSLPKLVTPAVPLLDTFGGAAFGYSLRQLRSAYGGACMKVRRSTDNATMDVGFISGYLNTTALLDFVAGGDGFVDTWYDQSGNARHVTQVTVAAQPKIVNAGVLQRIGSRGALLFDGSNDCLLSASPWGLYAAGGASMFAALAAPAGQTDRGILSEANSATGQGQYTLAAGKSGATAQAASLVQNQAGTAMADARAAGVFDGTAHHLGWIDTGSSLVIRRDETASTGVSYTRSGTLAPDRAAIGAFPRLTVGGFYGGSIMEAIGYTTAFDANSRQALALDQRSFYGTP